MDIIEGKAPEDTKIVVAMSGGVDSSVVACLLAKAGYQIIGITMQLYNNSSASKSKSCCAGRDIGDAKAVASKYGFPHYVFNYEATFERDVVDNFAKSYAMGETPIPCITCNQTVKFRDLLKAAKQLDADALATGHYVRRMCVDDNLQLHTGVDPSKDQSYFLFATTMPQLEYLRFPLGSIPKVSTRKLARDMGLSLADKPDSQDICFVTSRSYVDIVSKYTNIIPGDILDTHGKKLGSHTGIVNYTLGQRKRIDVCANEPMYVVDINHMDNTVTVAPEAYTKINSVKLKNTNWLCDSSEFTAEVSVRTRSSQDFIPAKINLRGQGSSSCEVEFLSPQRIVSPGQACVVYKDTRVLGGGWVFKD